MKRSEFRWRPEQIIELLPHLFEMRQGMSPFNAEDIARIPGRQPFPHAQFESMALLAAEFDIRISRCGGDGVLLMWHYCEGKTVDEISLGMHRSRDDVVKCIGSALAYISGRRKRRSYEEFKRH